MPFLVWMTSQYEMLEFMAAGLWSNDLCHLAQTCETARFHICRSPNILAKLVELTCKCSGDSGRAWQKQLCRTVELAKKHKSRQRALIKLGERTLRELACEDGRGGPFSARPCGVCGSSVCNACRYHTHYGLQNANPLKLCDEGSNPVQGAAQPRHTGGVIQLLSSATMMNYCDMAKGLYDLRSNIYCDNCFPAIQVGMPKQADGQTMESCRCEAQGRIWQDGPRHRYLDRWICVPCFEQEYAERVRTNSYDVVNHRVANACGHGFIHHGFHHPSLATKVCSWCNCEVRRS
ncbi:hypothetical protein LTR85_006131 [Meristemomyces frigidus]|nr:hypothetical protein LTR85_006131 [Meristemomyces frigidus]